MRLFLKGLLINFKFLSPIGWGPGGGGGGWGVVGGCVAFTLLVVETRQL